ncbi:unnamed protein product, partial [Mesorhabditis spiculigera]
MVMAKQAPSPCLLHILHVEYSTTLALINNRFPSSVLPEFVIVATVRLHVACQMSIFGKFKNLFKGGPAVDVRTPLPSIVQYNANPRELWDIIGELGDGAFGKVERVVSRNDPNLQAAEKCIEVQEGEELEDFLVEIEILQACRHENIVTLFACYYYAERLHMMLELCGGGAVDDIMLELERPLTEPQIAYIARYTCDAIRYLHQCNIIHRDLKAGNILLTNDGIVKLADFGVSAKLKDKNEKRDTFIGTPYWMAPEVMTCETFKDQPYDCRSDIWSFGITLIEMAQMEPPHSEVSPMRVLIKVQKNPPPTLNKPSSWSIYFNDFLKECLVKDPRARKAAEQLQNHPFLKSGNDRRSVLALLAEAKAEVKEVEVMEEDDRASVDESIPESEDTEEQNSAVWNDTNISAASTKQQPAPLPPQANRLPSKHRAPSPPSERVEDDTLDVSISELSTDPCAPASPAETELSQEFICRDEESGASFVAADPCLTRAAILIQEAAAARQQLPVEREHSPLKTNDSNENFNEEPTENLGETELRNEKSEALSEDSSDFRLEIRKDADTGFTTKTISRPLFASIQLSITTQELTRLTPKAAENEKYPAPPPPKYQQPPQTPVKVNGHVEPALLSPRQEAYNVLEELNTALDNDTSDEPAFDNDRTPRPQPPSPRLMPPAKVREGRAEETHIVHSPEPTRIIKSVVDNARHSVPTPSELSPRSTRSAHSDDSPHRHSAESVNTGRELAKSESAQSVHKTFSNIIRVRMDVQDEDEKKRQSAVEDLKFHFEKSSSEPTTSHATVTMPEGHVQSKIKQVIREQQAQESGQSAERIKSERREADSLLFQAQPAVSKMAESFEHAKAEPAVIMPSRKTTPVASNGELRSKEPSPSVSLTSRHSDPRPSPSFEPQPSTAQDRRYDDDDYVQAMLARLFDDLDDCVFAEDRRELSSTLPPPEPPVDYDRERRANESKENRQPTPPAAQAFQTPVRKQSGSPPSEIKEPAVLAPTKAVNGTSQPAAMRRKNPNRKTVTRKTRTFNVDGMEVTATTHHVMGRQENLQLKRQERQELTRLQREEARQLQELERQGATLNEQQEKKQQQEKLTVQRQFEQDLESLNRKQKKEIEEAERMQDEELKTASKRLKYDQEKDLNAFRERLKQEMKIVKQEVEMVPKSQRKEALRIRKGQTEAQHQMKEQEFGHQLLQNANATLSRMQQKHKEKIASLERQFTLQRHMLLRGRESAEWELDERVMSERYVLHRKLFKDKFFLLRTQMLARQQKEMAQMGRIHQMAEEEMIRELQMDRKQLPKRLRNEAKTRTLMFKESLRINLQTDSQAELQERMRRFEEAEKQRVNNACKEYDMKSARKIQEKKEIHAAEMRELEEVQNDNRKLLLEREHATMAEHERKYTAAREQWHRELAPKKMELEQKFQEELEAQEQFYGISLGSASSANMSTMSAGSISSASMLPPHMY